ncbi:uncharacterized protein [Pyxicephalus adspersus]|uniref:uncharacterized protein n=1 Tax=Pyxicephalus adspersus TaxID=30357 RepID=UPI003B58D6CE
MPLWQKESLAVIVGLSQEFVARCESESNSKPDWSRGLSLCDFALCDSASSECQSQSGLVSCECRPGYYKFSHTERSCRACESGFWWSEGRCQRCPLGYGGFNCQEAFLLAVIVESCAVTVLLGALLTTLFYYFRRKNRRQPTFMDSVVLGVPTDQPVLRLPRAQFSWRREWEWNDQPGKIPETPHQDRTNSEASDIQMRSFGYVPRPAVPNPYGGSHNLAFISDN